MKKACLFLFVIILSGCKTLAIEEVQLEREHINLDYISDVYYARAENQENISPVFKLFTNEGIEVNKYGINSVKASFLYGSRMTFNKTEHQNSKFIHNFDVIEPMIKIKFNENKTTAKFNMNLTRNIEGHSNNFAEKINELYISHDITPNQTILIGQGSRVPNTFNGSISYMSQEMVLKSQMGRTISNYRSVGIRNIASYKYIDYDVGVYDSTRYMDDFGNGMDLTGKVIFKPFNKGDNEISDFKIGAAYTVGNYHNSYNQYALYSSYDINKLHFKTEYANADGYNGLTESQNKADGFYTTAAYDINDKFSLIGRYDYFTQNKNIYSTNSQEYTFGLTYKPYKNMKIMLNYVRRNFQNKPDSNMILFATRFII